MAFEHNGKRIYFNDESPDFKFIKTIKHEFDVSNMTEYIENEWLHEPSMRNLVVNKTIKTYDKNVFMRKLIPQFGKMVGEDPSKYTTIGEEVFMEWNPLVFVGNNKIKKYCEDRLKNPELVREKLILNMDNRSYQPAWFEDMLDIDEINLVNSLYKSVPGKHIDFINTQNVGKSVRQPQLLNRAPAVYVPRHNRTTESTAMSDISIKLTNLGDMSDITTYSIAALLRKYNITEFGKINIPKDRTTGLTRDIIYVNFDTETIAMNAVDILTSQRVKLGYSIIHAEFVVR